ncbi:MAG: hypothetical protein AAGD25_07950 [Cyanobacteria bacterium P01_F01_bin.150]
MSQGQRVMAEIQKIRAALTETGDRLQKLPRKAIWIIHRANHKSYRLTYQLTPIRGWTISPRDSDASQLLGIIDRALHRPGTIQANLNPLEPQQTSYQQKLHPWCIVQLLPQLQHRIVARFRRRNDADAHLRILQQHTPSLRYAIIFDPALARTGLGINS